MERTDFKEDRTSFSIDGTNEAYNFNTNKRIDKQFVLKGFINSCADKDVKRVFCQVDRNSDEQVCEGMTTFGVETKDKKLTTIAIHENNYGACKDEMNVLNSAVNQAQERINRKNNVKARLVAIGASTAIIVAGGIKLYKELHNYKKPMQEPTTIETTYEPEIEVTESKTEPLTGADFIRNSQEQHVNENAQKQKEELDQMRQSYLDEYRTDTYVDPNTELNTNTYNYSFNDVVDNAENTKAVIEAYNEQQMQEQAEYVKQLRQINPSEYESGYSK